MTRRAYPRPPIVEAVITFRFAEILASETLLAVFPGELSGQYPSEEKRKDLRFLQSADGLRLLGCAGDILSVHVLAPLSLDWKWPDRLPQSHTLRC